MKGGKAWEDVRLWKATKNNEVISFPVADFLKKDNYWNIGTFRELAEEMKIALKADYSYPIIIDERGGLVDGAHRIVHAYLDGVETIKAVVIRDEQFPKPDYDEEDARANSKEM